MVKRRTNELDSSDSESSASEIKTQLMSMAKRRKIKISRKQKLTALFDCSDTDTESGQHRLLVLSESADMDSTLEKLDNANGSIKSKEMEKQNSAAHGEVSDEEVVNQDKSVASHNNKIFYCSSSASSSDSKFEGDYDQNLNKRKREIEIVERSEQCWQSERKLKFSRISEKDKKKENKKVALKPENGTENQNPKSQSCLKDFEDPIQSGGTTISKELPKNVTNNVQNSGATSDEYIDPKERSKERKRNVEIKRTDDKRNNAMALLKAHRQRKAKREEEEAQRQAQIERENEKPELKCFTGDKTMAKLKAPEVYSDSGSGRSETDEKPVTKHTASKSSSTFSSSKSENKVLKDIRPRFINPREELNKIRLSRFKMEKFINLPIFERTVLNCFVRINIGINSEQKSVYRIAEIVGVVETAKIYNLGKVRTNKGLRLKHANQECVMRLEFISNQEFTESEFTKWRTSCVQQNVEMPSADLIEKKLADIEAALNYEFKDEDIHKIIEEKNRFRNKPTNYAMKKACLIKEREAAMLSGDFKLIQDLSQQIEEFERRASEVDKRRSHSLNLIAYINDRNRKHNIEAAEKAILKEARAEKGSGISDPFTRRITQPRRMGFQKQLNEKNDLVNDEKHKLESQSKYNAENNNPSSLHDFDIDLDIKMPVITVVNNLLKLVPNAIAVPAATKKRSISLEEYKKKRGLI